MTQILDQQLLRWRARIDEIVKDLHELTQAIQHDELARTVSDLRNRINEPFMFVIVGEVKAGKSSFINALLATGKEITKVAPQPITDTVQQITYGEEEEVISINPYLKKILLPVDILREIAIVDTPGTNTIIEQHQEITERFVPASDLIVFVFEAKNPYRQSAWDFFRFIHADWRKKIIFVLQQKDLLDAADLEVNEKGVYDHAQKQGIADPVVFSVSARRELAGEADSGFDRVRDFIRQNITGGKAPVLKLRNNLDLSQNIHDRIREGLKTRRQQWEADLDFRRDIRETLAQHSQQSHRQADVMVENLLAGYDRIAREKEDELANGLSFFTLLRRSVAGLFSKQVSVKEWLEQLAESLGTELERELQSKLQSGVLDLAESIQQMVKVVDLKLQSSTTILKNNHAIFSAIAERRGNVLRELQEAFERFMNRTESFTSRELFPEKSPLPAHLLTGSGIAVIGAILTAATQLPIFDITGGILTTVGLLFAGVSTSLRRRKILRGFHEELERGRTRMEDEVKEKLHAYVDFLQSKIDANFTDFDRLLEQEEVQIEKLEKNLGEIRAQLDTLAGELPATT